jgi:hypothetical protein
MDAVTAAEWFGGTGAATAPGAIFGSAAPAAAIGPATVMEFGYPDVAAPATPANVLEYGFPEPQTPFTPAPAEVIPGYATPENVFEYGFPEPITPFNPAPANIIPASNLSLRDAFQGARLISGLLTPEQQQVARQDIGNIPQGAVDYSTLLGLLSQRTGTSGLLGTRFQPQSINIASLLG